MLVLSRKTHETILIGDDIRITVIRVERKGGQPEVGIGIQAPASMRVDREEVRRRIDAELAAAPARN
ncbi:MAG: carbon storage regulator [Candidatus Limnocylindrales bacterium]